MTKRGFAGVGLVGSVVAFALWAAVAALGANVHANARAVCTSASNGYARCHELVVTDAHGNPLASVSPTGLSPATQTIPSENACARCRAIRFGGCPSSMTGDR